MLLVSPCFASGLKYRLQGVDGRARDNVIAYLGEFPQEAREAERFLVSAGERVGRALEAVGIYDYDVTVSVDRESSPWRAEIGVTHGEPVRFSQVDVRLEGAGRNDTVLQEVVATRAPTLGDILHHGDYEAFKGLLQRRSRERGYFDGRFKASEVRVDAQAGTATLELVFDTGLRLSFGTVSVSAEQLPPELLAELQPFRDGDPYEQSKLLELRSRLIRLGYFDSVVVLPDLNARRGQVIPIAVDLQPAPRHSYELGAGFSTDTRQRLSLVWSSPRLNRLGHSQRTRLRYSPVNPSLSTVYSIPRDAAATDLMKIGARLEDNEFGDLSSTQQELSLERENSAGSQVRNYGVRGLRESWDALEESFDASYLLLGGSYSRRYRAGNVVDPGVGLTQFYELEVASAAAGSDQDLVRLYGSVSGLTRVGERSRLVGRLSAGVLYSDSDRVDDLPPSLAFFAGGDNSIRGYAYQSVGREIRGSTLPGERESLVVGGTRMLTGSIEYQRYFGKHWRGALFVDAGDAFVDSFDVNVGVGVGLHYLTPLGAIRIEVADPVTERGGDWRLHFSIGAEL